jgi:GNAT superfamily N-acetyltransferase
MVPIKEVETMHIHQVLRSDLESLTSGCLDPWLVAALERLLLLPDHPWARILVAMDGEVVRAILGLELTWATGDRLKRATISLLEVDPEHVDHGLVTRLIRFAEGITRLHRCDRIHVAPGLERWGGGRCRSSLGYLESLVCRSSGITPRFHRSCP